MNPTMMSLTSKGGMLTTTAPSLERLDQRLLDDLGLSAQDIRHQRKAKTAWWHYFRQMFQSEELRRSTHYAA